MAGGDVDEGAAGEHVDGFGQTAFLIVKVFFEMPAEADYRLGGGSVTMDGQNCAGSAARCGTCSTSSAASMRWAPRSNH